MVLMVDIGNTNIVLGAYDNDKLLFSARMETKVSKTDDEYSINLLNILHLYEINPRDFEGVAISSVVPRLTPVMKNAIKRVTGCEAISVSQDLDTGLKIKMKAPTTIGADRICGAVSAIKKYSVPCIIFDMGTATTICAIDREGNYLGGSIMPGVYTSLNALVSHTAQLPQVNLDKFSGEVIGSSTKEAMRSGIIIGTASMMDGMIERYKEKLGENLTVIATGGLARLITRYSKSKIVIDENLLLDGLLEIYSKNKA